MATPKEDIKNKIDWYNWPKYEKKTEYLTLWFYQKHKRPPTKEELKSLIDSFILPDDNNYVIPTNKLEAWAEEKKRFDEFLKNDKRKKREDKRR